MTAHDAWVAPTADQVVHALTQARDIIEFSGWCQREAHTVIEGRDCYCPLGAVSEACSTIRLSWPTVAAGKPVPGRVVPGAWLRDAVSSALLIAVPKPFITIPSYNDHPRRTRAEILNLFSAAIQLTWRAAA